uniref:CCHC-type domain-containing protein n=1 Tax=Ditylenchus dipsaci TaxID=166011 RepID=A0A915D0J3_9BILA
MGPLRNISGLFSVLSANKHNLLLLISVALTMPISAASQLITNTSLAAEGYCGNNTVAVRRTLEHLHETHIQPLVEWSQNNVAHAISSASPEYKPRNRDYPANSSRDSSPASNSRRSREYLQRTVNFEEPQPSQWEGDPEPYPVQQPVYLVPPDIDHDYRQSRDYGRSDYRPRYSSDRSPVRYRNPDRNIQCYYCRAFGHKVDRCPRKSNHPVSQYQRRQYNDYRQSANFSRANRPNYFVSESRSNQDFRIPLGHSAGDQVLQWAHNSPVNYPVQPPVMNEFGDPVYQTNVLIDPDLSRTSVHDPAEVIPQNSPANVDYPAQSADIHNPVEMISHKHPVKSPDQVSVSSATDPDLRQVQIQRKIQSHAEDGRIQCNGESLTAICSLQNLFEPETPVPFPTVLLTKEGEKTTQ